MQGMFSVQLMLSTSFVVLLFIVGIVQYFFSCNIIKERRAWQREVELRDILVVTKTVAVKLLLKSVVVAMPAWNCCPPPPFHPINTQIMIASIWFSIILGPV